MKISLCMIVKNEEKVLERCLESVKELCDEIIIVDTGSTDKTKEIAKKYTNLIYDFKWCDDFSKARNFSFSKATGDYILWLDADDTIEPSELQKLLLLKPTLTADVVMLKYNIDFDEQGNPTFSYYRERLLKKDKHFVWKDRVHEYMEISGDIIKEDIAITHQKEPKYSDRNLRIYQNMEEQGDIFSPRNLYYYGRELSDHSMYEKSSQVLEQFLETDGWVEDKINACILLRYCQKDVMYLFKTFLYDTPRSKTCCLLGDWFAEKQEYRQAIYWYELVFTLPNEEKTSFYERPYTDFIPWLNLSICYYYINEKQKAKEYFEKAKAINPHHSTILSNDPFFK